MKKGFKSCLLVMLILIVICGTLTALMFFTKACPPNGPWPMPPWCTANGQESILLPPAKLIESLPVQVPEKENLEIENAILLPTDVSAIDYPIIYNQPSTENVEVSDPYCAIVQDTISYPVEYLGQYEFPDINGTPLPANIHRIIGIKDVWIQEPNLNNCSHSGNYAEMREAFAGTLDRILALGADEITFSNYIHFTDFETATLQSPEDAAIPASDLRYIAAQADKMGLDMTLYLNLAPGSVTVSWDIPDEDWLTTLINNWEPFVLDQAKLAEESGIDALMINHFDYQPGIKGFETVYQTEMMDLLQKTRSVYSGKILLMIDPIWGADLTKLSQLLTAVDGYIYTPNTTPLENKPDILINVENLKILYLENLNGIGHDFGQFNKPILLRILIQSEKDFLQNGWNEDMFCIQKDGDPCYQKNLIVDFSVQAIAYEALLEAISEINQSQVLNIGGIDSYGYWFTDVILPEVSQPQIAHSIRNKPTESIVYEWFKR